MKTVWEDRRSDLYSDIEDCHEVMRYLSLKGRLMSNIDSSKLEDLELSSRKKIIFGG